MGISLLWLAVSQSCIRTPEWVSLLSYPFSLFSFLCRDGRMDEISWGQLSTQRNATQQAWTERRKSMHEPRFRKVTSCLFACLPDMQQAQVQVLSCYVTSNRRYRVRYDSHFKSKKQFCLSKPAMHAGMANLQAVSRKNLKSQISNLKSQISNLKPQISKAFFYPP